ncbi:transcription elongation factor GreA [Candidatus Acetothermia bacterium]|nr:MAG: transcription elongation factor GreA [Candidatus Acetothermia bacterium]RLE34469.1 MAG: transcription elongation factor GreA [Candidatus Acetothermia bacterium]
MPQEILLTKEGYERKKKQLEELEHKLYQEIPARLKEAKERGGDLMENREYVYLKNEQEVIEREVRQLRELLENARIISEDEIKGDAVSIGTRVILEDTETGEFDTYTLVSPPEADLLEKRIGIDSPVGAALMGHSRGDTIVVQTPSGRRRYRILGVEKG